MYSKLDKFADIRAFQRTNCVGADFTTKMRVKKTTCPVYTQCLYFKFDMMNPAKYFNGQFTLGVVRGVAMLHAMVVIIQGTIVESCPVHILLLTEEEEGNWLHWLYKCAHNIAN